MRRVGEVEDNDNNRYTSKALNPSVSDLQEAQSAVHVQLKPSIQRNQRHEKKKKRKSLEWAGERATSKY